VSHKLLIGFAITVLAVAGSACSATDNANANANANTTVATTTQLGADNSEISATTDATGVKTETRVFHNNSRVSRVVVTTRDGKRTTTVYGPKGEAKDLKDKTVDGLAATGNAIADAAGFVAEKTVDVADKTKEGAKTVGEKTVAGAKTVGEKTKEGAQTVGEKTKEGAQTVGEKTVQGAKKAGRVIKKAVTP
jgi:hypothetical protein